MTSPTPRTGLARAGALALAVCAALGPLAACTSDHSLGRNTGPVGPYRLVAFDTCDDALNQIRAASQQAVGPYGFGYAYSVQDGFGPAVPAPAAAPGVDNRAAAGSAQSSPTDQAPAHSDTNNQESGVDEPDLVKTDGNRILIVHNGVLNVIDAASHQITGTLSLAPSNDSLRYAPADLLLSGDHALVLYSGGYARTFGGGPVPLPPNGGPALPVDPPVGGGVGGSSGSGSSGGTTGGATGSGGAPAIQAPDAVPAVPPSAPQTPVLAAGGPRLLLIDLAGTPKLLSTLAVDGTLLDARQTGSIARIVVNSAPRITFPDVPNANQQQRIAANQKVIGQATLDHWLPRIDVATGSKVSHVQVGCDAISRPSVYSGSNLLTVLSLDLAGSSLDNPQPISLLADGQTVYSNGDSLYVATDLRWRPQMLNPATVKPSDTGTTVYQFDTSKPGRPSYVGGGGVPGYLVNQYAMSARDGYLRVATTSGNSNWESDQAVTSQSGVYVLKPNNGALVQVGKVEGLGKGEKIYAVRFLDNTAYVVTFKQTDPLYTVDLTDPTKPRVRGELKITGYSSYLHPIAGDRMIGLGQDVDGNLRTAGTQVSLFDVSSLDSPNRLAVYQLPGSNSQAEFDPHAFLYWPATGLLVIPINGSYASDIRGSSVYNPSGGALALHVGSGSITPLGTITQPAGYNGYDPIQRTLVIGSTLWTVSTDGLLASDLSTLQPIAWIPLV